MLALSWQEFQGFVGYVFSCAGYAVHDVSDQRFPNGTGVDLDLYADNIGGKLLARVEVRQFSPPNNIGADDARRFWGTLDIAGGIPGYLVTTSDFGAPARAVAAAAAVRGRLRLLNGQQLLRYIAYIRGSRVKEAGMRSPSTSAPTPPDCLFQADAVARRQTTETVVLTVGNNRGGVAKTTTALNLALALNERGWRVLLVDMDPQSSLTRGLPSPEEVPPSDSSLVDFFMRSVPLSQLVRSTRFKHLSLLPSHPDLKMLDTGGGARPDAELAFIAALHDPAVVSPSGEKFDWIILDTPPAQSFYTRTALAAAHFVLIPSAFDVWALLGINGVLETTRAMQGLMGTGVEPVGCLLTRYRASAVKENDWKQFVHDLAGRGLAPLKTKIRHDDRIENRNRQATGGRLAGILRFGQAPGTGLIDYQEALKELMQHVHHN